MPVIAAAVAIGSVYSGPGWRSGISIGSVSSFETVTSVQLTSWLPLERRPAPSQLFKICIFSAGRIAPRSMG